MKKNTQPQKTCSRKSLVTFLLVSCLLFTHSIICANVYSQRKLNISLKDVSLTEILKQIDQQTEYSVLYRSDLLEKIKPITVDLQDVTVDELLVQCLTGTGLSYKINDKTIVISKIIENNEIIPQKAMREIKGKITDTKKEPLTGATIIIKGTSLGAVANENGDFTLKVPENTTSIIVSFVGYKSKEVSIVNKSVVNVMLEEDIVAMEDVVITGFFNRKKEGFAGSVTTIQKADLQKVSTGNIFTTLSTIDAGFKIKEDNINGSNPNTLPDFTIRGKGSFQNGSTSPLFILDGFEVSAEKIFDMDINRIETITLLKDASATILYGSRAANGVIVIETVAPKPGQLRVTYDFKPTIALVDLSGYDLMDAKEKLEYERLAGLYEKTTTDDQYKADELYYQRYKNIQEGVNTYWLSQPVRTTFSHAHSLYVEGGVDNVRYGIDASYNQQNGVMKQSGRDRMGLGFSLIYRIKDKITIKNYISYAYTNARNSPYGNYSTYGLQNPYERIQNSKGELIPLLSNGDSNPLYDAQLPFRDYSKNQEFREQFSIDWMINSDFRLRAQVGINKSNSETNNYTSPYASKYVLTTEYNPETETREYTPIEKRGELTLSNGNSLDVSSNITLNYNKLLAEKHLIYLGIGGELNSSKNNSYGFTVTGFPDDRFSDPAFAIQFKENSRASSGENTTRSVGLFGNLNYIYDNRYFLDGSLRYDGSSRFGSDNRFASFWSLGAGWNIHNEKFWSKNSHIDLLKIRYSYGVTGNQEFSAYQAKTMYQFQTGRLYNTLIPVTLMGYGNPDLKWQNQYQSNIGLDFGMAKSRLKVTFNYYRKRTQGMLTSITVAPSLGLPSDAFTANLGEIKNIGYEVNINGVIIRKPEKDLEWAIFVQGANNKNTLVKISNQLKGINDKNNSNKTTPGEVYEEGQSMTALKAVRSLGIDPVTGQEIYIKKDGSLTYTWDADDKVLCGNTEPKFWGNVGTNLFWKGWNLNMVFQYRLGADNYNSTLAQRVEGANPSQNADRRVLNDRWITPGDHALYKNIKEYSTSYISTRFIQKEQLIQLSNLSLSYDFPREWLKKYKLQTLKLSFYANDLFRLSTIKEERGLSYPFQRSYVFGVNVSF